MPLDVRTQHYVMHDRLLLITAGDALIAWAHDLVQHESDGPRWDRTPDDDAVLMAAQLGWMLSATTSTVRQALAWYTTATDNARHRAMQQRP